MTCALYNGRFTATWSASLTYEALWLAHTHFLFDEMAAHRMTHTYAKQLDKRFVTALTDTLKEQRAGGST